jgi:hypothetical protein
VLADQAVYDVRASHRVRNSNVPAALNARGGRFVAIIVFMDRQACSISTARRAALCLVALLAAAAGSAQEAQVQLTRRPDKTYEVSGTFTVSASTEVVWGVLTDYERIPSFVASMRSSRVRETRSDGSLLVEQKAVGDMFFLSRTMRILLEVRRGPDKILFADVGGEDFQVYHGEWDARASSAGVSVAYHLLAQPRFRAPAFILSRAIKSGARDLLDQVRAEMLRRGSGR